MKRGVLALAFLCALSLPFKTSLQMLNDVWHDKPYIDELFWIPASNIAFNNFFVQHDYSFATWNKALYTWGNFNPPIGKYIMGLSQHLWGDPYWMNFPVREGTLELMNAPALPPGNVFMAARLPGFAAAYLSCVVLCGIVMLCVGWREGYLAALLFACNPILRFVSHLAVTDILMIFFGLLTMLFVQLCLRAAERKAALQTICLLAAAGMAAGLCIGSKLSGFICLAHLGGFAFATCGYTLYALKQAPSRKNSLRTCLWLLPTAVIAVGTIAMTVFILSNPFLYADTWNSLKHMYAHKAYVEQMFPEENIMGAAKLTQVLGKKLLGENNALYVPAAPGLSITLNALLTAAGLFVFARLMRTDIRAGNHAGAVNTLLLVSWCIIYPAATLWWVPKDWYRLLMPAMAPLAVLESVGLAGVSAFLWFRIAPELNGILFRQKRKPS